MDLQTQQRWQQELAEALAAGEIPGLPPPQEVRQTHLSRVFLGPERVYKLKRPLRYSYLDYSSPAARRRCCLAELHLNRRLARRVYREVLEVSLPGRSPRRPSEHLVVMERLPDARSLDRLLAAGALGHRELEHIGARLAAFHRDLPPVLDSDHGQLGHWLAAIAEQRGALAAPRYGMAADLVERLTAELARLARSLEPVLAQRMAAGRIVDGHGDLRPEHVYLVPEPVIIDCLEFSRRLRLGDGAEELAFLTMECRRQGGPAAAQALEQAWQWHAGERPDPALMRFYRAFRALLWAKLALWHLDREAADPGHWQRRAGGYLDIVAAELG